MFSIARPRIEGMAPPEDGALGQRPKSKIWTNAAHPDLWALFAATALLPCCGHALCTAPTPLVAKVRAHPTVDTFVELGTWFGDQQNSDCAADAFRAAIKIEPKSGPLEYMLGLSLFTGAHPDQAVEPLQQSVELAPNEPKAHLLLAAAFAALGRTEEAKVQWERTIQLDPTSMLAADGLAKCLIAEGDYASVVDHLRASPQDENLTLDLSEAYMRMGMLDEASATLAAGFKASPDSVRLTKQMVTVMVNQTRYQDASILAEKAARLHPDDAEAQKMYLRVLVLNGDRDIAVPLAARLLAASPHDPDALYLSGILERQAGQYEPARAHLEEAAALEPDYYNVHFNLGSVLAKMQQPKEARVELEKAIELGAAEPEIHFDLAGVLRALGDIPGAQEQLKLYQQALKDKAGRTRAAGKSAEAAQELTAGDPKKAAALYREAVEDMPQNPMLHYKLSVALDRSGDIAGERAALEDAVKIDPALALAQNQLGYLDSQSGDTASAEGHFRLALNAAPNFAQAWVSLAATLGMESRFPEALAAVGNALKLDPENSQALELGKALSSAQARR